jgi:sugar lactone lactonase YvrE
LSRLFIRQVLKRRECVALALVLILVLVPLLSTSFYHVAEAFQNGENASLVLGAPNFTSRLGGNGQAGTFGPEGIAIDAKGDIWIADSENNRVLEFVPPFSDGESASIVLGQENFTSYDCGAATLANICDPQGIVFDSAGDMYVADNSNNRILEFKPPFSNGESASLEIGVASNDTTQSSLNTPVGIALDSSGDLWVADNGNNRVVEFQAPLSTNESASLVIGQTNFVTNSSGGNQSGLNSPSYVAFDHSGNLWVTDSDNDRILEFPSPISTGENASVVIGQTNFTAYDTEPTQSVVPSPGGIAFDSSGNLWATDTFDGRVLEFRTPFTSGENASLVLGQDSFNAPVSSPTQSLLIGPEDLVFDSAGNLWVLDSASSRALEFALSGIAPTQSTSSTSSSSSTFSISTSTTSSTSSPSVVSTTTSSTTSHSASSISSAYLAVVMVVLFVCFLLIIPVWIKKERDA